MSLFCHRQGRPRDGGGYLFVIFYLGMISLKKIFYLPLKIVS